jgi:hypothetical protein
MGELGNTTDQATPGTSPPIHLPPGPDPHGTPGGAPTPGGASGPQVPDTGQASSAPDSPPPHQPKYGNPFRPPWEVGGVQNPVAPPPNAPAQDAPPSVIPPVVQGGGIGGIDSAGGSRSPYLPDPNNPFPPGVGPGGLVPPVTIDPTPGAGSAPGPWTTPPPEPQLPYVPGSGIPPAGTPPGPPVTETHTTPGSDEAFPMAPRVRGFDPVPPSAPGESGGADEADSGPRVEIG